MKPSLATTPARPTPFITPGLPAFLVGMALACILASPPAAAEVLSLEQVVQQEPVNGPEGIPRPIRGQSMEQVRRQFGAPAQELPWVGTPPITRWVYDKFTVYFEGRSVIDSVVNR